MDDSQGFTESLEVDDFPGTQEFYGFADITVMYQTQDVVIGGAGFLFCGIFINTTNLKKGNKTNQYSFLY